MKTILLVLALGVAAMVSGPVMSLQAVDALPAVQAPKVFGIAAAQIEEPPEFPAGHFCKLPSDVHSEKDHPCNCREHDDCSKPEEGQGTGPSENKGCLQWCHKDHCGCMKKCE